MGGGLVGDNIGLNEEVIEKHVVCLPKLTIH